MPAVLCSDLIAPTSRQPSRFWFITADLLTELSLDTEEQVRQLTRLAYRVRWKTFTFLCGKFTQDNMYQIILELIGFCKRYHKKTFCVFFSASQCRLILDTGVVNIHTPFHNATQYNTVQYVIHRAHRLQIRSTNLLITTASNPPHQIVHSFCVLFC